MESVKLLENEESKSELLAKLHHVKQEIIKREEKYNETRDFVLKKLPTKIIYVSCDPNTLIRDLKELESIYEISDYKILDMFSYTYHVESFCVLKKKGC